MKANKEKVDTQFFFDKKGQIVNGLYGLDTVTTNYVRFWFRWFCYSTFDVKDLPLAEV